MIALIDAENAVGGYEFVYFGEAPECLSCSLRMPCHYNLRRNRRYVVKSVRDTSHPCKLFGRVLVCEVDETEVKAAMEPNSVFEGSTIRFQPVLCKNILCEYTELCRPEGLARGDRCLVSSVRDKIRCPENKNLVSVKLKRT